VYQGVSLDSVKRNLKAMYMKAIEQNIVPIAATVLPYNSSEMEATEINELNAWIMETACRLNIPMADTSLSVANPANRNRLLTSADGLHPDVSGYHSMAIALSQAIEEQLKSTKLIERRKPE